MKQFATGFFMASTLWLGLLYAQSIGKIELFGLGESDSVDKQVAVLEEEAQPTEKKKKKRRGRKRRSKRGKRQRQSRQMGSVTYEMGNGISGDELGSSGSRELAMGSAGKEEQLSEAEIDRGIDRVFNGIERCLVLVPSEAPATGRVMIGMHISSSGRVTKVNLKGPKVLVGGDSGACIRRTVKSIKYPGFDGPDMIAHYPITFE